MTTLRASEARAAAVQQTRLRALVLQIEFVLRHTTYLEFWLPQMAHGLENRWLTTFDIYGLEPNQRARALLRLDIDWDTHDAERRNGQFLVTFATHKQPEGKTSLVAATAGWFRDVVSDRQLQTQCRVWLTDQVKEDRKLRARVHRELDLRPARPIRWVNGAREDILEGDDPELPELRACASRRFKGDGADSRLVWGVVRRWPLRLRSTGGTMTSAPKVVTSADGTVIAFDRVGDGPPVVLIGGAFNDRSTVAGLGRTLAPHLTVIAYDRRGSGGSGDNSKDYNPAREIDDLAAVIDHAGGSASVFGHSSGATLALTAAQQGLPIDKLALYEPPYVVDHSRARPPADVGGRIQALVELDRRDDAVTLFLTEQVGVPAEMVRGMRANQAMWGWLTGLAHTLPYDVAICGPGLVLPADLLATVAVPALVIHGGNSPPWMAAAAAAVAKAIPGARHVTLAGQDHGVLNQPDALRPVLVDFLT
jgi:pimeloyl-ACP methyl ester carboxylesterase